jgi:hypothetical protein
MNREMPFMDGHKGEIMKKFLSMAGAILCLAISDSCTHKLHEIHSVAQQHRIAMLIAGDSSDFKDVVRQMIIDKYRPTCSIEVVNISRINNLDAGAYDVVVIMDTCMAWSGFNTSLKAFLDPEKNRKKTVLAMTAGNQDWQYSYQGVDAITSASVIDKTENYFARIDTKIQTVLSGK